MNELYMEAKPENLDEVISFVDRQLEEKGCPVKTQMQIDIAVEELFVNIVRYAYQPETGYATIRVEIQDEPPAAVITFTDNGTPFNPLAKADPDITLSANERQIGGLGIFMVKKSMDDVFYEYKNGQNIMRIRKNF